MNEVINNLLTRRSIRSYQEKPVPRELLEQIVQAGAFAPTAVNRQRWQFTVVDDPADLQELAHAVRDGYRAAGARGEEMANERNTAEGYCCFYHAPALIILSGPEGYDLCRDDAACGLQNIFLAAHSFGIGSCWINQLRDVYREPAVRALLTRLGVPEDHRPYGSAALGYASVDHPQAPARREGVIVWAKK